MKIRSHLVAAIFGTILFFSAIIGFVIMGRAVRINNLSGVGFGVFLGLILPIICGIAVLITGIIEIVGASKTTELKGIGITAGILNIIGGAIIILPIFSWIIVIIGTAFAYIAYFKNT